jgi:uncharacterized Ntn-hydrolase superfamily protein
VTLSLAAAGPDGAFGMVIASSSPAVASRCLNLRAGVGAVASQNVTNPALGPATLDALDDGLSAQEAVAHALAAEPAPQFRQVTAVDREGRTAVHTGDRALGIFGSATGDGCIAAGNLLAGELVLTGMVAGFSEAGGTFEERLLAGLRTAVRVHGGEAGPIRSAGLAVVEGASWRVTDLRVDDHDDPVVELERLLTLWLPQKQAYLSRALTPDAAPSYGVPGDE